MRFGLIFLLLGLPGAALAAEDRYGPSRRHDSDAVVVPVSAPASASVAPAQRQATDYRGQTLSWAGKPVAAAPQMTPAPAAPPGVAPPQPVFATRSPDPARLPTSLYDAPTPGPVTPPVPTPPAPPPLAGRPSYGYSPPRSYSVVREWGGTPDRIPTPPTAAQFSGREVALDPNTLGSAQQADLPPEDDVDQEQAQQQRDQQQQNLAKQAKGARK